MLNLNRKLAFGLTIMAVTNFSYALENSPLPMKESAIEKNQRKAVKHDLVQDLSSGDILAGNFSKEDEMDIADQEMKLAEAYLKQGDRKNALIHAIYARKGMQRMLNNPYDPKLKPVYQLLAKIYGTNYDRESPADKVADKEMVQKYQAAIDKIQ